MGRSSAPYGGHAPEPLNRSGSPSPLLVALAATTPSINLPTAISPEIRLRNCIAACEQLGSGRSVRSSDPRARTRSLFVRCPARET
jgi:hypothetical protein